MENRKVYIENYGCQMNVDDSVRMVQVLKPLHYQLTSDPALADLILINTCSVREKASHKAHSAIGRFHRYKRQRPTLMLGLTGCQAQVEGKNLLNRFHYLDFVIGPDQIAQLPAVVDSIHSGVETSAYLTQRIKPSEFEFVSLTGSLEESQSSAFVTIMKGCDNFCSFCIVPFVRGREVSRPSDEIIEEIAFLYSQGVQEITLLGQNVNSYGNKSKDEISFSKLLERILNEVPIRRLRFTTSHPKDLKEDLMQAFRDLKGLAHHLHLPVQSGSTRVLQNMYRTYSREEYLRLVDKLRDYCPDIALGTDIIVGFPGETEVDFEDTLSLIQSVGFDSVYSFQYSPRPQTTAGRYLKDDVPPEIKELRLQVLQARQAEISRKKNEACVGKTYEVLIEGPSKIGPSFQGRNEHNRIVHIESSHPLQPGQFLRVWISRATDVALVGILAEEKLNQL